MRSSVVVDLGYAEIHCPFPFWQEETTDLGFALNEKEKLISVRTGGKGVLVILKESGITVTKGDKSAGTISVKVEGGEINGLPIYVIDNQYDSLRFVKIDKYFEKGNKKPELDQYIIA